MSGGLHGLLQVLASNIGRKLDRGNDGSIVGDLFGLIGLAVVFIVIGGIIFIVPGLIAFLYILWAIVFLIFRGFDGLSVRHALSYVLIVGVPIWAIWLLRVWFDHRAHA